MRIKRKNKILLFLDFDGVICDSEPECFESSSVAYRKLKSPENVSKSLEHRSLFRQLRPLIRSGEDYLVIHLITSLPLIISVPPTHKMAAIAAINPKFISEKVPAQYV